MYNPQLDCLAYNMCGNCQQAKQCKIFLDPRCVDVKYFRKLKEAKHCFDCREKSCCPYARECCGKGIYYP